MVPTFAVISMQVNRSGLLFVDMEEKVAGLVEEAVSVSVWNWSLEPLMISIPSRLSKSIILASLIPDSIAQLQILTKISLSAKTNLTHK